MKTTYFKICLLIVTLPVYTISFAQIDVFEDEIVNKNNIIYYQNQALTGTVYSNDEEDIPNTCQCTLKAHYKNGLLDGEKMEFYKNGKLKFKGNYKNGKPTGKHLRYNQNGQIIEKSTYQNSMPVELVFFENDKIIKKEIYKNGKLETIKEFDKTGKLTAESHFNGKESKYIEYYPDGKTKIKGHYKNLLKDGTWIYYDETGQKTMEQIYLNNELIGQGKYQNGQKNGKWYQYSPDKKIKTIKIYQDGKLIDTKTENSAYTIKNYKFKQGEILLYRQNKITGDSLYYVLNPMIRPDDPEEIKQVKAIITAQIKRRVDSAPNDLNSISDKSISKRIEIHDVVINFSTIKHPRSRMVNGKEQKYYEYEAYATVDFKIFVYPIDSNIADIMYFSADSQGSLAAGLLTGIANAFPHTRDEALNKMLRHINTYKFAVKYLPAYTTIAEIKTKGSKKVKSIKTSDGYFNNILKGAYFQVYDQETGSYKSLIKIYKAESNFTFGKVRKEGDWLKNYMNEHPQPWLKEVKP